MTGRCVVFCSRSTTTGWARGHNSREEVPLATTTKWMLIGLHTDRASTVVAAASLCLRNQVLQGFTSVKPPPTDCILRFVIWFGSGRLRCCLQLTNVALTTAAGKQNGDEAYAYGCRTICLPCTTDDDDRWSLFALLLPPKMGKKPVSIPLRLELAFLSVLNLVLKFWFWF